MYKLLLLETVCPQKDIRNQFKAAHSFTLTCPTLAKQNQTDFEFPYRITTIQVTMDRGNCRSPRILAGALTSLFPFPFPLEIRRPCRHGLEHRQGSHARFGCLSLRRFLSV
jgi:hypothetical protein